jgi:hypothetical protein
VPWGVKYELGSQPPTRWYPPAGTYTLKGKKSGSAQVQIDRDANKVTMITVTYTDYSDDGIRVVNGTEKVGRTTPSTYVTHVDWWSDLRQKITEPGKKPITATKITSPDGFHLTIDLLQNNFDATGTLTTTVDGQTYTQPANGT